MNCWWAQNRGLHSELRELFFFLFSLSTSDLENLAGTATFKKSPRNLRSVYPAFGTVRCALTPGTCSNTQQALRVPLNKYKRSLWWSATQQKKTQKIKMPLAFRMTRATVYRRLIVGMCVYMWTCASHELCTAIRNWSAVLLVKVTQSA